MAATDNANQNLVVTAFWEVNSGEEGTVAELLKDFLPQAQREPGVKAFQIHQNVAKPREFFFYEVFAGEAAFAEHQQTDHFKNIILGQAIPKLARARTVTVPLHLNSGRIRRAADRLRSAPLQQLLFALVARKRGWREFSFSRQPKAAYRT